VKIAPGFRCIVQIIFYRGLITIYNRQAALGTFRILPGHGAVGILDRSTRYAEQLQLGGNQLLRIFEVIVSNHKYQDMFAEIVL
jgi:hypothetical protein